MKTPGFWISRLDAPDDLIMTADKIRLFNRDIVSSGARTDIAAFPASYDGCAFRESLKKRLAKVAGAGYYCENGRRAGPDFFAFIEKELDLDNMPGELDVTFGIVVVNSDQRVLPTSEKLTEKPLDIDFDELQNNALDVNTPVAVLWRSADGVWSYAVSPSSTGWILSRNIALCWRDDIERMRAGDFAVITEAKADVYFDKELTRFYCCARMGTRFGIVDASDDVMRIEIPLRDEGGRLKVAAGYVRSRDSHMGYLPCSARVIVEQAFEMLNTPYGWGGANGEQDCSQFLQEVFAVAGLDIPRNSSAQSAIGVALCEFDAGHDERTRRDTIISKARPGLSLMYMKGHIMLYLGSIDGIPYAIHDTWAFRRKIAGKDTPLLINKVTVSDLSLGQGSAKGSLLERLKSVRLPCGPTTDSRDDEFDHPFPKRYNKQL